jgi:hypothetical protein
MINSLIGAEGITTLRGSLLDVPKTVYLDGGSKSISKSIYFFPKNKKLYNSRNKDDHL